MKPRPLYSSARSASRPRPDSGHGIERGAAAAATRSRETAARVPPLAQGTPPALPRLLRQLSGLTRRPQYLLMALLSLALLFALGLLLFRPRPPALTQKAIDAAVKYSLEHAPPAPSNASVAYEAVRQAVVRIRQLQGEGDKAKETGVGTGVVITEDGLIITNYHVISGAARLSITFSDGTESGVDVVSADPDRDLALLKALQPPEELKPANLRSVAGLKTGDEVFALGFPFGIGPSLSAGVISGLDRSYVSPIRGNLLRGLIQFDAASNPGNSGGPLLDRDGDVVGLVTSILNPYEQRVFIGIAFAVPIEQATRGFALNPF